MKKFDYSVDELIRINELFDSAASVLFHQLNKHVYLEIIEENGEKSSFTLTKRDFAVIKRDFFIAELNNIIEFGLDEDFEMGVKINPAVESFPVEIIFTHRNEEHASYICNFKELGFIYNALKKQKGSHSH